jgi:pimeloyl-ACP methyl ester carboxylesterase
MPHDSGSICSLQYGYSLRIGGGGLLRVVEKARLRGEAGLSHVVSRIASPVLSRLMWPAMLRKIFGPRSVPEKFAGFPKEMAVRPSQIRASAAEAALMVPAAFVASKTYGELEMPTIILAGEDDRLIDIDAQSARLHDEVKQSKLHRIAGAGHMIQQSDTPDVMAAIDEAAAATLH